VLKRVGMRQDNIVRAIRTRVRPLREMLKAVVKRQRQARKGAPVSFIPFGKTDVLTRDVAKLKAVTLKTCPKSQPLRVQLATVAAASQLWTDRWATLVGKVPAPTTARYRERLRKRLLGSAQRKLQIVNTRVKGTHN